MLLKDRPLRETPSGQSIQRTDRKGLSSCPARENLALRSLGSPKREVHHDDAQTFSGFTEEEESKSQDQRHTQRL